MNAHTEIVPVAQADEQNWAKLWRSDCIDQFSLIETGLQHLLNLFAGAKKRTVRVKTHQPVRQALEEVCRLARGSFKEEARPLAKTLMGLEKELDWRAHLTHGELRDWVCRGAKQRMLTLRLCDPEEKRIKIHAYPESETIERLERLKKLAADLKSQMGLVRGAIF